MSKPTLYVDVDDAIIAKCHHGSGFDLRPGVITQLRVLSRLFNCQWLTCWDQRSIFQLIKLLYGGRINSDLTYANWDHGHPWRKAGYVLNEKAPKNWWWIEDPLCSEEIEALKNAGKLYRYIRVEPFGNWAFLDAINELFLRSGVGEDDIKRVGGNPDWFKKEAIFAETPTRENMGELLDMLNRIAEIKHMTPEERLTQIQQIIQEQLSTLYPLGKS